MILYIANRSEIARRIIRTARKMGFKTAVGYADQDRDLPFVVEADLAESLKGEEAKDTYIHFEKVLKAAKKMGATHLHPGYGFLSENASFAKLVRDNGIEFVGPSPESMELLGDKIGSRSFLKKLDVPLLPSYDGADQSLEVLRSKAKELGFPLLIKPSAGGGGKGMIRCYRLETFDEAVLSAKRIARSSFGDDRIFLERLIEKARHIEVQVVADKLGNTHCLGERECSLQRNHQKILEETPCVFLSPRLREKIYEASKKLVSEAGYFSVGTVEWIWDGADGIYFLEMNTRLQVEHPVTELVWGVDLVEVQLKIALGEVFKNLKAHPSGHSIEVRICAEDPSQNFLPSGGKIHRLKLPESVRVDFGYRENNSVPPQFDSMLGKIIAHADNRIEAIEKLRLALSNFILMGPTTNRAYLIQLLDDLRVQEGNLSTDLVASIPYRFNAAKAFELLNNPPLDAAQPTRVSESQDDVHLDWFSPWGSIHMEVQSKRLSWEDFGSRRYFHTGFADWSTERPRPRSRAKGGSASDDVTEKSDYLRSPMPAKVAKVFVSAGQKVKKGDVVLVLEAMKMEYQLKAPREGEVLQLLVKEGERVQGDMVLVQFVGGKLT